MKMKKVLKITLILMAILTVIYVSAIVYANANSSYDDYSSGEGKDPIEYDIWRHYLAEKLETEPHEWNTTEELGIVLVQSKVYEECYHIYIADPEKALPWMNGTTPTPYAVKYADKFYQIVFLWVAPGLPESVKQWQIPIGGALGVCWIFTGVLFLKWRKKE